MFNERIFGVGSRVLSITRVKKPRISNDFSYSLKEFRIIHVIDPALNDWHVITKNLDSFFIIPDDMLCSFSAEAIKEIKQFIPDKEIEEIKNEGIGFLMGCMKQYVDLEEDQLNGFKAIDRKHLTTVAIIASLEKMDVVPNDTISFVKTFLHDYSEEVIKHLNEELGNPIKAIAIDSIRKRLQLIIGY